MHLLDDSLGFLNDDFTGLWEAIRMVRDRILRHCYWVDQVLKSLNGLGTDLELAASALIKRRSTQVVMIILLMASNW